MGNERDLLESKGEILEMDDHRCEIPSLASSHLLGNQGGSADDQDFIGDDEKVKDKIWVVGPGYLVCLTIGTGGLQVIWTAIMGHGSVCPQIFIFSSYSRHYRLTRSKPKIYLSSLGLPPHVVSFIWLAGPLSGAVVHPYISVLSDRSSHSWGQRKPYILWGTVCTIISMILLPRTGSFVNCLFTAFDKSPQGTAVLTAEGIVAGSLIWALNVAIQPVQMGLRALICEACPSAQKVQATAYASVITGVGSVFGYASGLFNLPEILPWFGDTQFKCLCVTASLALGLTVAVTLTIIEEKQVAIHGKHHMQGGVQFFDVFRQIHKQVMGLPKDMKNILQVQFFAWLGWFPFLFYITTYIAGICNYLPSIPLLAMTDIGQMKLAFWPSLKMMFSKNPTGISTIDPFDMAPWQWSYSPS